MTAMALMPVSLSTRFVESICCVNKNIKIKQLIYPKHPVTRFFN